MTWTPKGWWTPTPSTLAELRLDHLCHCLRCTDDGQHNLLCEVHEHPPLPCDCTRGDVTKSLSPTGAS